MNRAQSSGARAFVLYLPAVALLVFSPLPGARADEKPRLVVVFYPDGNDGRPGSLLVERGIRAAFLVGSRDPIEVNSEYLDVSRFREVEYAQRLAQFIKWKYSGRKVDLVIAGLAPALDFVLQHRADIFPGVPVVFCAIEQREILGRKLPPDVVGTPVKMEMAATLEIALRLQPATRRVYVIAGKATFDTYWEAEARRTFRPYEDRLEFVYWTGLPLERLLRDIARLPEHSIVYYLHIFQDGTGSWRIPAEVAEQLARAANAPVYGHVDTYLGRGVVGGRVFGFETTGKKAAELGLRILAGERAETLQVGESSESIEVFDWRQLRRWGINEASLPPECSVQFREPQFWDLYKWHVLGVTTFGIVETLLIVGLLLQRASRQRAEQRFRQVVETAPTGMLLIGQDGTIVLANARLERLFGYPKEEMLGQPVEMLLPERFREQHVLHRAAFLATPHARAMGSEMDLFGRRKDGSEFPVEVGLSPVRIDTGLFVLASIIDVTERRKAVDSLRESRHELQVLTGKLIQAQETERRRIARELHDDVNQRLALLSVELDLLSHEPPESADEMGERAQRLAVQVKQLSSDVHDLSHRLHPSKLEQLGLLIALRGLCGEVAGRHGLPITFAHDGVPEVLAEGVALCLYRIAQEALRNAVKHSGARQVKVAVGASAGKLCLCIVDDGTGFDPESVDHRGRLGLISMVERLRLVGGAIRIDSRPGEGTRIEVLVPLAGPALVT